MVAPFCLAAKYSRISIARNADLTGLGDESRVSSRFVITFMMPLEGARPTLSARSANEGEQDHVSQEFLVRRRDEARGGPAAAGENAAGTARRLLPSQ